MPRRRNPELNAGDSGVELGPSPLPPAPPLQLWVVKGCALRPRVGGGRIPVLFAVNAVSAEDAQARVDLRRAEIESGREYTFEALLPPASWGEPVRTDPRIHFWIGHGVSMWQLKELSQQIIAARHEP